jgi:hypothetical protein
MTAIACPCCGHLVFGRRGDYEICPICYWEDDLVQIADPWFAGGANRPSLEAAQQIFVAFGAMEERFTASVRRPHADDAIDPNWRPVSEADRAYATTPREIEALREAGKTVPYEYWLRHRVVS